MNRFKIGETVKVYCGIRVEVGCVADIRGELVEVQFNDTMSNLYHYKQCELKSPKLRELTIWIDDSGAFYKNNPEGRVVTSGIALPVRFREVE